MNKSSKIDFGDFCAIIGKEINLTGLSIIGLNPVKTLEKIQKGPV